MYKNTSKNTQGAQSGFGAIQLEGGDQSLTPDQQRENLVRRNMQLTEELKQYPINHPARKKIGLEMQLLQQQIKIIPKRNIHHFFYEICRTEMPEEFKILKAKAEMAVINYKYGA